MTLTLESPVLVGSLNQDLMFTRSLITDRLKQDGKRDFPALFLSREFVAGRSVVLVALRTKEMEIFSTNNMRIKSVQVNYPEMAYTLAKALTGFDNSTVITDYSPMAEHVSPVNGLILLITVSASPLNKIYRWRDQWSLQENFELSSNAKDMLIKLSKLYGHNRLTSKEAKYWFEKFYPNQEMSVSNQIQKYMYFSEDGLPEGHLLGSGYSRAEGIENYLIYMEMDEIVCIPYQASGQTGISRRYLQFTYQGELKVMTEEQLILEHLEI